MKNMAKRGKMVVKKWVFRGKKWVFGVEKIRVGNQTRKAKWCKMQVLLLKIDKTKGAEGWKKWRFTYFLAYIFARTERKLERHCKIKDRDLRF